MSNADRAAVTSIVRVRAGERTSDQDLVAAEAPLAIELRQPARSSGRHSLGIVMRTPGDDEELVLGLLHGEGIIHARADVLAISASDGASGLRTREHDAPDVATIDLDPRIDLTAFASRALAATSACGLCGRLEIQAVESQGAAAADDLTVSHDVIAGLPAALRNEQAVFAETGGLHAAALFDVSGRRDVIREDVGRHNAVDKAIGWALAHDRLPASRSILAVSGRVAFEIVQKAAFAGIPIVAAVGAPSSLAVSAARSARLTLIGFVRDGRFNIYTNPERVK